MNELAHTTAVILAGGFGTRLRSVVSDKPKVLAEVQGRPFICYLLDQIVAAGVKSIVLCTGYMADSVKSQLGPTYRSAALMYSKESTPLGTGGAVRLALPMIESDVALVLNGDSYCEVQLNALATRHRSNAASGTITLSRTADTRRYGRVEFGEDGRVLGFSEKAQVQGAGWVNAGIYLLNKALIRSIPTQSKVSIEHDVFPNWIGRGLFAFCTEGQLWDIGLPEAYADANAGFQPSPRSA